MIKKKINITTHDYEVFKQISDKLNYLGVTILEQVYDTKWYRYDIRTEMTYEQALTMIIFTDDIGGFLWKGEA